MTTPPIKGKVARILNSRELVINIGSASGVVVGMQFDVMDPKGDYITDPDTNEVLGSIPRPKIRVQVTVVQERLAVAATFRKKDVNVGGRGPTFNFGFGEALMPPKWVTVFETLKTTEKTWEDIDEKESFVKTGDPVVQVTESSTPLTSTESEKDKVSSTIPPKQSE